MKLNKLSKLIENHQEQIKENVRDYIGASSIGSECLRKIWYQYKGFETKDVSSKTRRTWDIGKKLEELVIKWLLDSEIKILQFDITYFSKNVPQFQGHIDALVVIDGINHILEIKTAKDSSFQILIKKGVKVWSPQYHAQIQSYMGMSSIKGCYIFVLNKDTSDIYDEFIEFDEEVYKDLERKALIIATATTEPPRINHSPLWYQCKICSYNRICHK